ncbi:conserved hypothetical protein [Shewanella denitrificans OS217]|jgi:hypothetical protein|uniref:DUF1269 domain-containing protein n=1 Tax=Shewanella denitrificans (strain OS217 / ATCC BAA-1090 / DSM 15013) TaxID=318161 RepID=Q12LY5_SHEDO|nr:hypothetical protein [Shewanella denitrificans]ABE55541.1 conserved hypothetical protein [Shewanella denitrificans OS217]
MNHYTHYVSGFFEHNQEADDVFTKLIENGLPPERVKIYTHHSPALTHKPTEGNNEVLKDILVDGTIGAGVGTGIGALIEVALIATNVTLFVASPLIAPLVLLGWGASIGGVVGASIGAAENKKPFSALIEDAIKNGQVVLVVEARTAAEKTIAQELIKDSIGDYKDSDTA